MKLFKLIRILFKKKITDRDLVNLWLIPCFWETIEEIEATVENDKNGNFPTEENRKFYADRKVSNWKYKIWRSVAFYKARRYESKWFRERRFPFFSYYLPSKYSTRKGFWSIDLNCAPSVKTVKHRK